MGFLYGGRDNFEKAGGTIRGVYKSAVSANSIDYVKFLSYPVIYTLLNEYKDDSMKVYGGILKGPYRKTENEFVPMKYKHHNLMIDNMKLYGEIPILKIPKVTRNSYVTLTYSHYPYTGHVPEYMGLHGGILYKFEKVVS